MFHAIPVSSAGARHNQLPVSLIVSVKNRFLLKKNYNKDLESEEHRGDIDKTKWTECLWQT